MNEKEIISLSIYDIVHSVKNTFSLPTHATLEKTFYYSVALLFCSILSELLGFYTFISWQGDLLCVGLLVLLLWMERSENDALLKMYRTAKVSAEKAVRRAKTAGSNISNGRGTTGSSRSKETPRKRKKS